MRCNEADGYMRLLCFLLRLLWFSYCPGNGDHCKRISVTYYPSVYETKSASVDWEQYCVHYKRRSIRRMLHAIDVVNRLKDCRVVNYGGTMNVSMIQSWLQCSNSSIVTKRLIEPLYSIFRHPEALTCKRQGIRVSRFMFDPSYLILDDTTNIEVQLAPQKMYYDLGASNYEGLSQNWMLTNYKERGIVFDKIFLWEPSPKYRSTNDVPAQFARAYHFFREPATSSPQDPRNPLNMIRAAGNPEDFIVLKIDIDNSELEHDFIDQILQDASLVTLIDELFWEPHFKFGYLIGCCWNMTVVDSSNASTIHKLFTRLRNAGIRAHGWP